MRYYHYHPEHARAFFVFIGGVHFLLFYAVFGFVDLLPLDFVAEFERVRSSSSKRWDSSSRPQGSIYLPRTEGND